MTDEEIAREVAENILEIPVLNRYMIPEMADIILAAIKKAKKNEALRFWHEGKDE